MRAFRWAGLAASILPAAAHAQAPVAPYPARPIHIIVPFPAGGAAEAVARAEPEGYTLLSTPPAPLVINPILDARLPCDPTQFVPAPVMAAIMKEDAERWRKTIRAAGVNGVRR